MQAHHFHKPENVLKRAEEYINVGKKKVALELLRDLLQSRRHRTWQKTHEKIMVRYLDICVDLKDNQMAKEGLHQYRNISQNQAPGSLEVVIEFMIKLSDMRTREAAAEIGKDAANEVEDLDNDVSPEAILLATVTSDKSKDRSEKEFLVPWLKFMWETYRTVLEILKQNPKLEHLYHSTAQKAFGFCKEYTRNTEFRRLCDVLRNHLANQQKYGNRDGSKEIGAETLELHMSTRFEQLKVASALRLWHEGFRTIEDIHQIMTISKKKPSSQLMATYFQKLQQMFLVAHNYLFHAYAYKAFYILNREKNKSLTIEQSQLYASCVLLAALAIPLQSSKAGGTFADENLQKEKNRRMAQLLGFDINPKRRSLLEELLAESILDAARLYVTPEVKQLYILLEDDFAPLTLVSKVVRLVAQLSTVYYSVRVSELKGLLKGLSIPFIDVEKLIVKAVKNRQLEVHRVRIDHQSGCIRFGEAVMEESRTREMLTQMTSRLVKVCAEIKSGYAHVKVEERQRKARTVLASLSDQHDRVLARKKLIEARKEEFDRQQAQKLREEQRQKQQEILERRRREEERMREQQRRPS